MLTGFLKDRWKWVLVAVAIMIAIGAYLVTLDVTFRDNRVSCGREVDLDRWSEPGVKRKLRQQVAYEADDCETLNGITAGEVRNTFGEPRYTSKDREDWVYLVGQGGRFCGFQSDSVHMVIRFGDDGKVTETETYST